MKNRILIPAFLLITSLSAFAQVVQTSFSIKYNHKNETFDTYLKVEKGSTDVRRQLTQFNSQLSVITPQNAKVKVTKSYYPITDDKQPSAWIYSNQIRSLGERSGSGVHSFVPSISPTSFYNDIKEGDEIILFSFTVSPKPSCDNEVRLYDNKSDRKNSLFNFQGADFSNGFAMGSPDQLNNNDAIVENILMPKGSFPKNENKITSIDNVSVLNAGEWSDRARYEWIMPNGLKANTKDLILANDPKLNGKYILRITNDFGCSLTEEYNVDIRSKEVEEVKMVSVYPNPAKDFINITVNAKPGQKVVANITNVAGQKLINGVINEEKAAGQINKNIALKLNAGLYIVELKIDGRDEKHPFIIIE